jgi:hypothetical protein
MLESWGSKELFRKCFMNCSVLSGYSSQLFHGIHTSELSLNIFSTSSVKFLCDGTTACVVPPLAPLMDSGVKV